MEEVKLSVEQVQITTNGLFSFICRNRKMCVLIDLYNVINYLEMHRQTILHFGMKVYTMHMKFIE